MAFSKSEKCCCEGASPKQSPVKRAKLTFGKLLRAESRCHRNDIFILSSDFEKAILAIGRLSLVPRPN